MATLKKLRSRSTRNRTVYAVRCGKKTVEYAFLEHRPEEGGDFIWYYDSNIVGEGVSGFGGSKRRDVAMRELRRDVAKYPCKRR